MKVEAKAPAAMRSECESSRQQIHMHKKCASTIVTGPSAGAKIRDVHLR